MADRDEKNPMNPGVGRVVRDQRSAMGLGPKPDSKPASAIYGDSFISKTINALKNPGPLRSTLPTDRLKGAGNTVSVPETLDTGFSAVESVLGAPQVLMDRFNSVVGPGPRPQQSAPAASGGAVQGVSLADFGSPSSIAIEGFNMGEANDQFAAANRIRQQTIDAQPRGAGVVAPEGVSALDRVRQLSEELRTNSNTGERNQIYRALQGMSGAADLEQAGANSENSAMASAMRAQIEADQRGEEFAAGASLRAAQEKQALAQAFANLSGLSDAEQAQAALIQQAYEAQELDFAGAMEALAGLGALGFADGGLVESYADGGFIDPTTQGQRGTGAMGSMGAVGGNGANMQLYQQYASKAQGMGLPLIGFEEFMGLTGQAKPVQGFAEGGMVSQEDPSQVDGKMVVDTDPNAPTDSIPAVIDGQRPAALDSGEFVMPTDVVQFYGTDKLSKMIQKARDGGTQNGAGRSAMGQLTA